MGLVDSYQGVGGGQKVCIISRFALLTCAFVFCSVISFVSFFKRLEDDSCCVCACVYYLFPLSPVSVTMSYWGIEIESVI